MYRYKSHLSVCNDFFLQSPYAFQRVESSTRRLEQVSERIPPLSRLFLPSPSPFVKQPKRTSPRCVQFISVSHVHLSFIFLPLARGERLSRFRAPSLSFEREVKLPRAHFLSSFTSLLSLPFNHHHRIQLASSHLRSSSGLPRQHYFEAHPSPCCPTSSLSRRSSPSSPPFLGRTNLNRDRKLPPPPPLPIAESQRSASLRTALSQVTSPLRSVRASSSYLLLRLRG